MRRFFQKNLIFALVAAALAILQPIEAAADVFPSKRLRIREADGSPDNFFYDLTVTNGTLTDNGDGTGELGTGGAGGGAPTDASYLTLGNNGDLTAERVLTEGLALDFTDGGADSTLTVALDPTELTGNRTWGDGSDASMAWTFNLSGTDPVITAASGSIGITGNLDVSGSIQSGSGNVNITNATGNLDGSKIADADLGDFTFASGVATIDANAVALATDTTGNYVATIADSGASEVTVANSGAENAAVTLAIAAGITRDTEWDTIAEIETATAVNIIVSNEIDTLAELETLEGSINIIQSTEIDTLAELETLEGSINIIQSTEIDTSAELKAILTDETGSGGAAVFATGPTLSAPNWTGLLSNANTGSADAISLGTDILIYRQSGAGNSRQVTATAGSNAYISSFVLNNQNTGAAAGVGVLLAAGADTANIGGFGATRTDAASNSNFVARVLSNGSLTGTDTTAPFYISGSASGTTVGINGSLANIAGGNLYIDSTTTGVKLDTDGDGALILLGSSNGNDEDLQINLDDGAGGANTVEFTSNTGVTRIDFTSIDLQVPTEVYDSTGWNGDNTVPTKDAVRDKIETMLSGWTDNGATVNSTTATDNFIIGSTSGTAGTSGQAVLGLVVGTAPTTSPTSTVQLYAKNGTDNTKLVLHHEGANNSTTFTDSSAIGATITANGNAKISTAQFKFGSSAYLGDGSGDYLTITSSSNYDIGTSDYTVESWVRFSTVADSAIVSRNNGSGYIFYFQESGSLEVTTNGGSLFTRSWTPTANTWYLVSYSRVSSTTRVFVDGTKQGADISDSNNYGGSGSTLYIYDRALGSFSLNGYADDTRMIIGQGMYTANFTPPSSAFPNSSATAELLVRDELGNVTTLSPHNVEGLPHERVQEILKAGHIPMTVHHSNDELDREEWVDIVGLAMAMEELTGKKFIFQKDRASVSISDEVLKQMVADLKAENPSLDVSGFDQKEIERRHSWIREKIKREAEFQINREDSGDPLKEAELPPDWMRPMVEKVKEEIREGK